jgi:YHS domain-containing protein
MSHHDPVCGKRMNPNKMHARVKYRGETYLLCCALCQSTFENESQKYAVPEQKSGKRRRARDQ